MIRRLQRRISLLVTGVLILVSVGIVLSIYAFNNQNIIRQVESALEVLTENRGIRPAMPMRPDDRAMEDGIRGGGNQHTPPPKPDGTAEDENADGFRNESANGRAPDGRGGERFRRERILSGAEVASLSNYYTMTLDESGQIRSWESDRAELYSQETLQAFADRVLQEGSASGRIGDQFYQLMDQEDGTRLLVVLDARLEMAAGQRVLRVTALVAAIACLALSLGAWFLIRRMIRPVEETFEKQQQFVRDASHELKTPLAVISANADVLAKEIGENEYLGYIRSEVRRTDSLVRNLLTLARMDRGTMDGEMRETNLSEAVTGVLLPFESTVFEAGKTLETEIRENVRCRANEAMIQQLTVILLSNALKYSDEGGKISVRLEKKGRGAELRVENTGKGIAQEDLDRIFDRFYRTDASRNSETGGEGLGLAIARSITEIHHGKIRAESTPGKNAAFIVTLP